MPGIWQKKMNMIGDQVLIDFGEKVIHGIVNGFENDGSIVINYDGKIEKFQYGEIIRITKGS